MLIRRTATEERGFAEDRSRRDSGLTFVEILIAIVLLGTVVIGVLAALRTTIIATDYEREHARAGQWLQSAAQAVENAQFGNCIVDSSDPDNPVLVSAINAQQIYLEAVRGAPVPEGWDEDQILVRQADIDVWDEVNSVWVPYASADLCHDDGGLRLQRVLLTVRNPEGRVIETLEVVKRG